jgi:uncharacterized membrane protein
MSNGRSRWVAILLAVSLALNLLLAGAFIGRLLTERRDPGTFPPHMGWILRGLPDQERQQLRPVLRQHQQRAIALRRQLNDAQREASRQLGIEELNEQDLLDALGKLRAASNASQQAMHDSLVDVMKRLEPGQRKQVMQSIRGDWRNEMRRRGDGRRSAGRPPSGGRRSFPPEQAPAREKPAPPP